MESRKVPAVLSLITLSGRSQLSCHEDPHAARWGVPQDKEWRAILPTASTNSPTTGGSHLGRGPPAHCHTVRWPQPWLTCWLRPHQGPWHRPVLLSHSWIPDPQKLSKRRNVYCSSKPRSFRVTCYSSRELTHVCVKRPCNNTNSSNSSSTRVWL